MRDSWYGLRRNTKGWEQDPPARIHPNIMFGSGAMLTKDFAEKNQITHVINCAQDEDSPSWFRDENFEQYHCIDAMLIQHWRQQAALLLPLADRGRLP